MDCGHSKAKMNVQGDRLSMLPDDLVHRIPSLINLKYAIQTSALSSRWRFLWTSMPHLNISTDDFCTLLDFSEFVNNVLSHRNDQTEVHSVNLSFRKKPSEVLLKTILDYAFCHNIQQLTITWLHNEKIDFPHYLFCSKSLKHLRLTGSRSRFDDDSYFIILASTWDLPALTTLRLDYVAFYDDKGTGIFPKCANLTSLTLSNFTVLESNNFTVCHPQLSNLKLKNAYWTINIVNVVAPQLKSLTIRRAYGKHLITAPNLASLVFESSSLMQFYSDMCYLEKVDLCIYSRYVWDGCRVAELLQKLHNVKFFTLNLELVKPLSSYLEQISLQPSPFSNLKSLKIYPVYVPSDDESHKRVKLSTEVIKYLLDGSPTATFTLISYEEIKEKQQKVQAIENAVEAQKLMANLQAMLEKEKANIETCADRPIESDTLDEGKPPVEKVQLQFERKMTRMKSRWEDVGVQIDRGRTKTCDIISQLRDIEVLLLKDLPTSKRDELQACFSSLRAEVDTVVKKTLLYLSGCFNELATTSLPSF